MASADDGDLRWSPKNRRTREGKRITTRNIIPLVNTFNAVHRHRRWGTDSTSKVPRIPQPHISLAGECDEDTGRLCANAGVQTLTDDQKTQYELVKPLGCVELYSLGLYHCNFIARPTGGTEADDRLCFAEVDVDLWKELEELRAAEDAGIDLKDAVLTCAKARVASVLGPPGTGSGLNGCNGKCAVNRDTTIHHPSGVLFHKGR